ncbi:proton-conducting transporter membrane subunit [Mesorhizobium sp. INR15]|uniref:proton-conducting transporter transmembrane domain-containing protein n=1 Tax=Mesorhizobium sp. INR15 TaxID=2654248 RepID=UPI0035BC3D45
MVRLDLRLSGKRHRFPCRHIHPLLYFARRSGAAILLFFLLFTGSMLGVILSGNLIVLVVFWELTSITSFLLIGYWHHNQTARDGARMSLTVPGVGGLALLGGVLIIGHIHAPTLGTSWGRARPFSPRSSSFRRWIPGWPLMNS